MTETKTYPTIQEALDAAPVVTVAGLRMEPLIKPSLGSAGYVHNGEYLLNIGPLGGTISRAEWSSGYIATVYCYSRSYELHEPSTDLATAISWCSRNLVELLQEADAAVETVRRFGKPVAASRPWETSIEHK